MKLKDYISELNKLVEANPDILELDVIYSVDDEGNEFDYVSYPPSLGMYEDGSFDSDHYSGEEINAICIN